MPQTDTQAPAADKEDDPIVVELEALDDRYLELEHELEKQKLALRSHFTEKQQPLLEQRARVLSRTEGGEGGTPALKDFWLCALMNHPDLEDAIQEWDEDALRYLANVTTTTDLESRDNFRIDFHFVENPYFENSVLTKEYFAKLVSPYKDEIEVVEIKASTIMWKPGMDVTRSKKKAKERSNDKSKKSKRHGKEQPRPSFFRSFCNLKLADGSPEDRDVLMQSLGMEEDDFDDCNNQEILEAIMDQDNDIGKVIADEIVPFAVRWYTGEARPDDDSEDDDEEDEEEESEGSEHEDCQESEQAAAGTGVESERGVRPNGHS